MVLFAALTTAAKIAIPLVEKLITSSPDKKAGPDRKDVVRQILRVVADKMLARGETTEQPTDDSLNGVIEAIFDQMKSSGQLTQPMDAPVSLLLIRGTIQKVDGLPL